MFNTSSFQNILCGTCWPGMLWLVNVLQHKQKNEEKNQKDYEREHGNFYHNNNKINVSKISFRPNNKEVI